MGVDLRAGDEVRASDRKPINLALQGGGAHGAFTWGVLDTLLANERLEIESITGTSAGAMNAVVLADGYVRGGAAEARAHLQRFWTEVGREAAASPLQRTPWDAALGRWNLDLSPAYIAFDLASRLWSPYDLNPFDFNPLRALLDRHVDFERLNRTSAIKLFVSATNVHTGHVRVFKGGELSLDAVMASACLPFLYKAVEIDGTPYWDGGYMGNPALWPLFYECRSHDIVIVQINPIVRRETPRSAREILNRVNEISFNASLLLELRAINFVGRLLDLGRLDPGQYRHMLVHMIDGGEPMRTLQASSKFNAEPAFLDHLFALGQSAARLWMAHHLEALGHRSTVDLPGLIA